MVSAKEEPDRAIPPAVDGLLRVHKQIVNVDRDPADSTSAAARSVVTRLLVADTQAGSLIGKQGATIKSIQDTSGCTIRVLGSGVLTCTIYSMRKWFTLLVVSLWRTSMWETLAFSLCHCIHYH